MKTDLIAQNWAEYWSELSVTSNGLAQLLLALHNTDPEKKY